MAYFHLINFVIFCYWHLERQWNLTGFFVLQQNVFPDRGTVYDFYFVKQASGSWNNWIERVDKAKSVIPKDAKVTRILTSFNVEKKVLVMVC